MIHNPRLDVLSAAGVSIWLDDLSRNLLLSGKLQHLIDTKSVVGVTTNPPTFEPALGGLRRRRRQSLDLKSLVAPPQHLIRYGAIDCYS